LPSRKSRLLTAYNLIRWGTPRRFFSANIPYFNRVLLVESGSRHLLEELLPGLYATHPELERLDLITCYSGAPAGFDAARGDVYNINDWRGPGRRAALFDGLRDKRYTAGGLICSGEPIMAKWKWAIAALVPTKYFLLNENGDYVWFDYVNWRTLRHYILVRLGLGGAEAVPTLARLLFFPFTFAFLLSYAAWVHFRRWSRT
jgi:hypothetical protein